MNSCCGVDLSTAAHATSTEVGMWATLALLKDRAAASFLERRHGYTGSSSDGRQSAARLVSSAAH
jgi:hypothetical protein